MQQGWQQWDWRHVRTIAEHGYLPDGAPCGDGTVENTVVSFPGSRCCSSRQKA